MADDAVDELTDRGITQSKAELLVEAGYDTVAKVEEATEEDLQEIDGIGPASSENIKEALEGSDEDEREKIRPELDEETKRALKLRDAESDARPTFRRQNAFRYVRVGEEWRAPRGTHSKQREGKRYRPAKVKVGYRGPKAARGLHPSGFEEVLVHRPEDLDEIDPATQAARIGSSVGGKKRERIIEEAREREIRVLNPGGGG